MILVVALGAVTAATSRPATAITLGWTKEPIMETKTKIPNFTGIGDLEHIGQRATRCRSMLLVMRDAARHNDEDELADCLEVAMRELDVVIDTADETRTLIENAQVTQ